MIQRSRVARNRDIALTMLIDLLVQVIFVFTLVQRLLFGRAEVA